MIKKKIKIKLEKEIGKWSKWIIAWKLWRAIEKEKKEITWKEGNYLWSRLVIEIEKKDRKREYRTKEINIMISPEGMKIRHYMKIVEHILEKQQQVQNYYNPINIKEIIIEMSIRDKNQKVR